MALKLLLFLAILNLALSVPDIRIDVQQKVKKGGCCSKLKLYKCCDQPKFCTYDGKNGVCGIKPEHPFIKEVGSMECKDDCKCYIEEASTTEASTTEASTTEASTTDTSTTEASTTEASTTEASTTEASTTEASTTESPTTEASTTEASTTEASTTEASTTEASTTEASTTEASTTEASTTEASTTEVSTTEASTTEASTTEASTTEASTTEASTTEASTTEATTTGCRDGDIVNNGGCLYNICINNHWVLYTDIINPECLKCHAWGDPHFTAFSGVKFDWQYECNYALTQAGNSMSPAFGVFMDFDRRGSVAYVGPTTYQEDMSTTVAISLGSKHLSFDLLVNGLEVNEVTSSIPELLVGPAGETTVYAWRTSSHHSACLRLYGRHNILVELCKGQYSIWAPIWSPGEPMLGGLCGNKTSSTSAAKVLVGRNGDEYTLPEHRRSPDAPNAFGYSWQAQEQTEFNCPKSLRTKRNIDTNEDIRKTCSNETNSADQDACRSMVNEAGLTGEIRDNLYHGCLFDLCIAVTDPEAPFSREEVFNQTRGITAQTKSNVDSTLRLACEISGGTCQNLTYYCFGELEVGSIWCRNPETHGCCIPPTITTTTATATTTAAADTTTTAAATEMPASILEHLDESLGVAKQEIEDLENEATAEEANILVF